VFKQITSILLLLAFAIQTFSGGFVVLNYYTNTAAFAKNCVNKARPKMHCNGKCQMMKKLKEEEEKKDQQLPERKVENKIEVLSSKSFFYSAATAFSVIASKATTVEKDYPLTDISYSFFRPPQV
jgi:hypothetical protein